MKYALLLLLLGLNLPLFGGQTVPGRLYSEGLSNPDDCRKIVFERSEFTSCLATPGVHHISMKIKGRDGILYRGFPSLSAESDIPTVAFAVNGGMYDTRSRPIGYYVEDREKLHEINQQNGDGNFYLKPNGIFFGTDSDWRILTSEAFDAEIDARPEFGTQSGPMLVINGEVHAEFAADGQSKYIRNAVGIDAQGGAHFVISDQPVSFGKMARMMRDKAGTPNALYLDGEVSALWNPAMGRMDGRYPLGPLILVSRLGERNKP